LEVESPQTGVYIHHLTGKIEPWNQVELECFRVYLAGLDAPDGNLGKIKGTRIDYLDGPGIEALRKRPAPGLG
jgi:hypothetical protein